MAAKASRATLPNYFRQTDFEALFRKHPLPDEFERGMYRWSADRIRAHQEMLFQEVLANAWTNRFYQQKWRAAGLEPGDVRGLDDLHKLPIVTVYDFKEGRSLDNLSRGVGIVDSG